MARRLPVLALFLTSSACSFLIDFDELQEGAAAPPEAGSGGTQATGGLDGQGGIDSGQGGLDAGGQGGTPDLGIPLEAAPAELAQAVCGKLSSCFGTTAMSILYADEECAKSTEHLILNTLVAAVRRSEDEGRLDYDGTALPACLEAYDDLDCEDVTVGFPDECKRSLSPLRDEGATCAHALECDEGLYCEFASCDCTKPAKEGDDCLVNAQCEAGLTCFLNTCQPYGDEGDACGGGVAPECITGLICVTADEKAMMPGRCFPAEDLFVSSAGQSCNAASDPPTLCREGLACPVIALLPTCVPIAARNGACQLAIPDMCPENQYCSSGACVDLPGPGEACATSLLSPSCAGYSRCISGTCRLLGDNGNTCVAPEECWSGICTSGICSPPHCQ